jgi:fatty-acyl-CoA synthase
MARGRDRPNGSFRLIQEPCPSQHNLPLRPADFSTLSEALDYAARGETGLSFYDARGRLVEALPYSELRERARTMARRLIGMGLERGDRIAIVAENGPDFAILFFASQYAGFVPVALPISLNLGSHESFVRKLRDLLNASQPALAVAPDELFSFLDEAGRELPWLRTESASALEALPVPEVVLSPTEPEETAYLQFTSGSTQAPRGVVISETAAMSNLKGIVQQGLKVRPGDRCVSWLPFYHDMGLVGFLLGPLVSQRSTDYMRARDFAVRPVQWLKLISRNRGTISFSPPIGYWLAPRRLRERDLEGLDLSSWRVAGIGAEMIRLDLLESFAKQLEPSGFDRGAFLPCYGLAESTLAVTFAELGGGAQVEYVDADVMADRGVAVSADGGTRRAHEVVNCGLPLPGHELVIRDEDGVPMKEGHVGRVTVCGPSVMSGYFEDADATAEVLDENGCLDTGDLGYMTPGGLFITGRRKDLIIINGRNIWPQDLEHLAEQQPEVRIADVVAFGVVGEDLLEHAVLVVQCRTSDVDERARLVERIQAAVYQGYGIQCRVDLVPPNTLPKTSSGKLSRSEAKRGFMARAETRDAVVTVGVGAS